MGRNYFRSYGLLQQPNLFSLLESRHENKTSLVLACRVAGRQAVRSTQNPEPLGDRFLCERFLLAKTSRLLAGLGARSRKRRTPPAPRINVHIILHVLFSRGPPRTSIPPAANAMGVLDGS